LCGLNVPRLILVAMILLGAVAASCLAGSSRGSSTSHSLHVLVNPCRQLRAGSLSTLSWRNACVLELLQLLASFHAFVLLDLGGLLLKDLLDK
jgi:hypothetical protein